MPPDVVLATSALAGLDQLWQRGRSFLGTRYAILGGAMSWVSEHNLVAAISNAGGFGVLACGSLNADQLSAEIAATEALTEKPFGVNLITMHPDLDRLIAVCLEYSVGHVVLAGGLPSGQAIKRLKDNGSRVLAFAPSLGVAKRLVRQGVDALIIEGAEAGGHIGPVATSVLAQEILPAVQAVPVFVAGGIGRGEAILSYLEMGAAGCQLGTRFVCAYESVAHAAFKKAFIRASARDAVPTTQLDPELPVIPVRALVNNGSRRFVQAQREVSARFRGGQISLEQAQLEIELFWAGALKRAVLDGDVENGSLMAGQSVGMVTREQATADIVAELVAQAVDALDRRRQTEAP
ncbi:MAG: 2-nitropropane dioxygenase [Rhodospirillales bacterium]|nr:MAG: 2-nitropropane dioxygenase [Rhodospirillales bacterium]